MALGAVLWCVNQICPSGPAVIQPGWLGLGISNSSNVIAGGGSAAREFPAVIGTAVIGTGAPPGRRKARSPSEPSPITTSAADFNFTPGAPG
jgi:hypothetical protein